MNLKTICRSLFIAVLSMQSIALLAQNQTTISGTVKDESGETLPGVNIRVEGKVVGTITMADGTYSLTVNQAPPLTLIFSYVGYQTQTIEVTSATNTIDVTLVEQILLGQEVVVSASRIEESLLTSPVSIEKMDILDIQNTAATSFYDGIANMKGVDFSTQSLTFKSVNTRGFGANGNTRFVQLIDGIDNQAPGLNFSVGNIVGINDLDLESAEMLPGAASALYGPNAINGILLLTSKNPFDYQGLSVYGKVGVNHVDEQFHPISPYQDYGIRYAKAFNNKIAFKVTASYLTAQDWVAADFRDQGPASFGVLERGATERGNNRVYDGLNTYGDFLISTGLVADLAGPATGPVRSLIPDGLDGLFSPTGFAESSFVDNTTESIKVGGALHYRLNDNLELFGQFNYGSGSTVYTANDRFVLDDFSITTTKLELKGSEFYVRAYNTSENSGDSYAANTLASLINQQTYLAPYLGGFIDARLQGSDIEGAHAQGRIAGDAAQPQPGSPEFNSLANQLRGVSIADGGARFLDRSQMWHAEGSWDLSNRIDWAEIVVGANWRQFNLNSEGTLFALDNDGQEISFMEYGAYGQITKRLLNDNLTLQGSLRYDKNENFQGQLSPRLSAVYSKNNHNIRASFQRGFRLPTTQDQFIDLDVVTRRLIGSNQLLVDRYNFDPNNSYVSTSVDAAVATGNANLFELENRVANDFKPEKINTYEIGYKGLFADGRLLIDAYYYYSQYTDFIAEIDFTQAVPNGLTGPKVADNPQLRQDIIDGTVPTQRFGFDINAQGNVQSQGWALQLDYTFQGGYTIGGNVAYNELISQQDLIDQGFRAAYNTPKYRYNIKFENRKVTDRLGFNVVWRWQQAFLWESSFGVGVIPEFGTLDAQISYRLPEWKSTVKLGASNLLNDYYVTSIGNPSIGGIYYIQVTFDEFFK